MAKSRKQPARPKPAKPSPKASPAPMSNASRARASLSRPRQDRRPGRPTMRTPELEQRIIDWIANAGTLRAFCRQSGMPSYVTVYAWMNEDPAFKERFERAREVAGRMLEEEILDIADNTYAGEVVIEETTTVKDEESGDQVPATKRTVRTEDLLGHRKLQIDARMKLLKVWFPDRYGDRLNHDHKTGGKSFDALLRKAIGVGDDDEEPST